MKSPRLLLFILLLLSCTEQDNTERLTGLPTNSANRSYTCNQSPLAPSPLYKLPLGAIRPEGWLREQLDRSATGMAGRLGELSEFLKKEGNAWLDPQGKGHSPWEEVAYWLRGFTNLAYVLQDSSMAREALFWLEAVMQARQANGYFGTAANYGGPYLKINRKWRPGDELRYTLPMPVVVKRWARNKNAATIQRGPLTYSLKIEEAYQRNGGTEEWPAYNILAASAWNYGLSHLAPERITVVEKSWPEDGQPWSADNCPVELRVPGKQIRNWTLDLYGLVDTLQTSPIYSDAPEEELTLIPMGSARLRITAFPVIGEEGQAKAWEPIVPRPAVRTSYYYQPGKSAEKAHKWIEEIAPSLSIPTFCWWPHLGTQEWVEQELPEPQTVREVALFWFYAWAPEVDMPESWAVQYLDNGIWKDVEVIEQDEMRKHDFNRMHFRPVETTAIRAVVKLKAGKTSGIMGWEVK